VHLAALALLVSVVVSLLYARTWRLNRQLLVSRLELSNMAHHDALTGLPNRNLLDDRLERLILQAQRNHATVAVCMLDLDGFKPINDQFGHDVGDQVLQQVAQRIVHAVRASDTVARFGGDEFVILVNEIEGELALQHLLGRVTEAVAESLHFIEPLRVAASIGVSIWGRDASDATTLMRHADEAMYRSKAAGGNRFTVFAVEASGLQPLSAKRG
jgi:diguanylate cyclase (GGDEF)-like protein